MKQSMPLLIASMVIAGLLLIGCSQSQHVNQGGEPVSVKATIIADCIVHYYKTNASAYITQQEHGYNPEEGFLEVVSTEPGGKVKFTLQKDSYSSTGLKQHLLSDLPKSFWSKNLAIGVFYSFCAGGGLLNTEPMVSDGKVKIEGRWYQSLTPEWPTDIKVTLFQALDTKRIELVQIEDNKTGLMWLLSNYNIMYDKDLQEKIPRTIDVFDIRNGIASKELMIRIDYENIQKVEKKDTSKQD